MRAGMSMAAAACFCLGIFPTLVIRWMDSIPQQLIGARIGTTAGAFGWMWLTPVTYERASYSGPIVFFGILAVVVAAYVLLHVRPGALHRVPIWDCGFQKTDERMQYNATSFAMPIRRIFGFLFSVREKVRRDPGSGHTMFPRRLQYSLRVRDRFWGWIYKPVVELSFWTARKVGRLQQGRIQAYLIYSFITIIVLLVFLR